MNDLEEENSNYSMPIDRKYVLTVKEASIYSNIGINKLYEIINTSYCPFLLKVGNKNLIKRVAFEEYLLTKDSL